MFKSFYIQITKTKYNKNKYLQSTACTQKMFGQNKNKKTLVYHIYNFELRKFAFAID